MRRQLRQVADAGKDIELQIVKRWWQAGYLLSAPPLPDVPQTQFIDPDVWLTCTTDAILLHPGSNRGVVNEVKSKSADVIAQMKRLIRGPDKSHVNQVKTEIGMAHEQGRQLVLRCFNTGRLPIQLGLNGSTQLICPEHMTDKCLREEWIEPVVSGRIYYVSRDSPADTFEFYYDYDPRFMKVGRSKLKLWKDWFLEGKLPQTQFEDKRFSHPFGWLWTKDSPCLYCDYGEICREDHKVAVAQKEPINLTESAGIQQALEYREDYDLNLVKVATERYWDERSKYVSD